MKYYIIAGEPSGDLHGSNLMKAIVEQDKNAEFKFWGGDHMLDVDNNIVTHIRETSIMGFVEVVKNLSKIKSFFQKAKATILDFQPDILILIDYPGFNLRMAKWAKKRGFKVAYYISPQLWAWKKGRIKTVKKYVDEMIVILPFELDFYKENGVKVHFVGHPLLTVIQEFIENDSTSEAHKSEKPILAILPGSRKQEIKKILPELVSGAMNFKEEYRLCVAMAPNIEKSFYIDLVTNQKDNLEFVDKGTYQLLAKAELALVTSGTATLETALFQVPQVVCYKTSIINYEIGKRLVDLEYISLVNLISGKQIVPELIQSEVNSKRIIEALNEVRNNSDQIIDDYKRLNQQLSIKEPPHEQAAKIIVKTILE
jgi:lipid-A-disaccharide synthase